MNPLMLLMLGDATPPYALGAYAWADGGSGSKSVSWVNANASPVTLTLGAWGGGVVSWVTASPVVIAGKSSAIVTATKSNTSGTPTSDVAPVSWTCEGSHGSVDASATYYEP